VTHWTDHLLAAAILLPLVAGALMILAGERRRGVETALGLASTGALVAIAIGLVAMADGAWAGAVQVYRLGDWPSEFAIVLVLDRLSALMVLLASGLGLAALLFSLAGWQRAGSFFHPLLQFQLMGLNGTFLTGDLFNLFVFFEVMLAASYGLALHGSGTARVRAGLHYIAINLAASMLFLIGVSMIYGVAGTLNMADLAARMPQIDAADRALVEAGAAILGVAFLVKAAMWPLGFWLPTTYAAAAAPSAAILSILSKVGIYAVLRLWLLLFDQGAGPSAGFGEGWLLAGGLLTLGYGAIAVLATQDLARLAGASVLVSSGTLLAAIGMGEPAVTAGALFYLAVAIPALAAFFLLIELVERGREVGADVLAVSRAAFGGDEDDAPEDDPGIAIPATAAVLGFSFLACAALLAGLPPLSGFLAKFAILAPLLDGSGAVRPEAWWLMGGLILSGLTVMVAMARIGIEVFWTSPPDRPPRIRLTEIGPILALLALCAALTVRPAPVLRYMEDTARALHAPAAYVEEVVTAAPMEKADEDKDGEPAP
jgi:multicomponent K+:H+ antiporter subunit D